MSIESFILLLIAGILGGAMNAVAGGASLITFPAMMAIGLSPIVANASNTVATSVGTVTAAWRERHRLPKADILFWSMCITVICGGAAGGSLLLSTDPATFETLVPLLIFAGTALFAFAPFIQKVVAGRNIGVAKAASVLLSALFAVAVYGGYFGAGLGVLVMASLCAFTHQDIQTNNALKNLLGPLANFAAIPIFVWNGLVEWWPTFILCCGVCVGAQIGVCMFRILPTQILRPAIIVIGLLMTIIFAYRVWL